MEIRKFRYEDIESVYKIAEESLKEEYTMDLFLHLWELNPDGFLVAEKNSIVIGFVTAIKTGSSELRILLLAVDKKHRGRGIGSSLLKHLIMNFPEVRRLYLETRVDNKEAIKFYEIHGFKIKGKLKDFYTDGSEAYLMEKIIF